MSSYTYVTTGFSSGLGAIARPIVEQKLAGWHHILLCRDPKKITKSKNLTVIECNLSSMASIKAAADKITNLIDQGKVPPLKQVIYNAGLAHGSRTVKSVDGYEDAFFVNVIAIYILLKRLLPYLKSQKGARVFVTGSNTHYGDQEHNHGMVPKYYWDDEDINKVVLPIKNGGDEDPAAVIAGRRAYSTSKMGVLYLMYKIARENKDIKFIVYEPGFVPTTGLSRSAGPAVMFVLKIMAVFFRMLGWAVKESYAGDLLGKTAVNDKFYEKVDNISYCSLGELTTSSDESFNTAREEQLWKFLTELDP